VLVLARQIALAGGSIEREAAMSPPPIETRL